VDWIQLHQDNNQWLVIVNKTIGSCVTKRNILFTDQVSDYQLLENCFALWSEVVKPPRCLMLATCCSLRREMLRFAVSIRDLLFVYWQFIIAISYFMKGQL
jgi:hypothetical protein